MRALVVNMPAELRRRMVHSGNRAPEIAMLPSAFVLAAIQYLLRRADAKERGYVCWSAHLGVRDIVMLHQRMPSVSLQGVSEQMDLKAPARSPVRPREQVRVEVSLSLCEKLQSVAECLAREEGIHPERALTAALRTALADLEHVMVSLESGCVVVAVPTGFTSGEEVAMAQRLWPAPTPE